MAKKTEKKIVLERTYRIPLRKEFLKVPRYKRAKKSMRAVKEFLLRHMKGKKALIGKYLNLEIWKHGAKNPPHHINITTTKDEEGTIRAELFGAPVKEEKPSKKVAGKKEEEKKQDTKKPENKEADEIIIREKVKPKEEEDTLGAASEQRKLKEEIKVEEEIEKLEKEELGDSEQIEEEEEIKESIEEVEHPFELPRGVKAKLGKKASK